MSYRTLSNTPVTARNVLEARVTIYCPYCHQRTSIAPIVLQAETSGRAVRVPAIWEPRPGICWWFGPCNGCDLPVLVKDLADTVFPYPIPEPTNKHVPDQIRGDLDEAKLCLSVGAWNAASAMARRALQRALIDKGANVRDKLFNQVDQVRKEGLITTDLAEAAHAIRDVGNDGAHPPDSSTEVDARESTTLAEQFMNALYVTPALTKSLRDRRAEGRPENTQ